MSNTSEQNRIAELKSIRNEDNKHIIDKAIENGTSAKDAAYQAMLEKTEAKKLTDTVAEAANRNRR